MLQDKDHLIWHPFTQEKLAPANVPIVSAKGVWLKAEDGRNILDGISSWWTNVHGHSNKYLADAIYKQALTMEHVIFAGFTHPKALELSERILDKVGDNYSKVFFSDNGSTSNEVALKMAIQYFHNKGEIKNKIIAFQDSYHGDTFGVMSTGGRGSFTAAFEPNLFDVYHLDAPNGKNEAHIIEQLKSYVKNDDIAAFAFEPLVMGTAGMVMYSNELLETLCAICKAHDVLTIADEVFTGFYRAGDFFSYQGTKVLPDLICMSKGLTGGTMTLGLTVCTQEIYDAFYSDDKLKMFSHGHSYTGNPLACSAACASLDLFDRPETKSNIKQLMGFHTSFKSELEVFDCFENIRQKGTILAFEVKTEEEDSYFNPIRNKLYDFFLSREVLLRPLGNTVYLVPPYCITKDEYSIMKKVVLELGEAIKNQEF